MKRYLVLLTAPAFIACADSPISPQLDPSAPVAFGVYASDYPDSLLAFSELEQAFLELERKVPGFAGFYRENGALVVLSARDPNDKFSTSDLRNRIAEGRRSGLLESATVSENELISRVDRAQFGFRALAIWRLRIRDGIFGLPGVTTLDLDEGKNRIAVGVERDADRTQIREFLAEMQVPLAAVDIRLDPEAKTAQATLGSRIRPLTAGTRVGRYNNYFGPPDWNPRWTATNWCTLGISAMYQGAQTILQVSHCTNLEGILENPAINYYTYLIGQDWYPAINGQTGWNPPAPLGYNPFGYEQFDRRGPTCGPFWDSRPCRHAEVAVWNISGIEVIAPKVPFTLGRIARPLFSVPGTNPAGHTININPSQPYFTIGAEVVNPVQGDVVQKVGLTTGWTHGVVYQTCVDINYQTVGNIKRRAWCQDRANLGGSPGDSGSPVFRIFDPGAGIVYFYGLVSFQGTDQPGSTGFASVRQLRAELGTFQVF